MCNISSLGQKVLHNERPESVYVVPFMTSALPLLYCYLDASAGSRY